MSVTASNPPAAGGTRQWFAPPPPAVNTPATVTSIYNGFVCPPTGTCTKQVSAEDLFMDIVKPGDPTQSFLWYKINGTQNSLDAKCIRGDLGACGLQMPLPGSGPDAAIPDTPAGLLPQATRDLFCNWIVQGALNN